MITVDVLGTQYKLMQDDSLIKTEADGLCKSYSREILYRGSKDMLCEDDPQDVKEVRFSEVLRHELLHAFFFEAGLESYGSDELLIDFLAKQFPKMVKMMENCKAITREEMR